MSMPYEYGSSYLDYLLTGSKTLQFYLIIFGPKPNRIGLNDLFLLGICPTTEP